MKSGQLEKDVLIDILSDKKAMCFGPGYKIVNRASPASPPQKLLQIYNINYGSQTVNNESYNNNNNSNNNSGVVSLNVDYSTKINAAVECDLQWDVIRSQDGKLFTLIPHTNMCTVKNNHVHSETKHSLTW